MKKDTTTKLTKAQQFVVDSLRWQDIGSIDVIMDYPYGEAVAAGSARRAANQLVEAGILDVWSQLNEDTGRQVTVYGLTEKTKSHGRSHHTIIPDFCIQDASCDCPSCDTSTRKGNTMDEATYNDTMDQEDIINTLIEIMENTRSGAKLWEKGGHIRMYCGQGFVDLLLLAADIAAIGSSDVRDRCGGRPRSRELYPVVKAWQAAGFEIGM